MFAALLMGGAAGLVAGGLLYHAASVFDGVDGEIARATFRTSRSGALLDSLIDMATNFLFGVGLTINLAAREPMALTVGAWGVGLFILGMAAIGLGAVGDRRPFSMNGVKERLRAGGGNAFLARSAEVLIAISSRDFCALLAALMVVAGWPMALLLVYAAGASVWILFVLGALVVPRSAGRIERSA
jgi:CDP-L-myo-inositol myo-inositolphosphotransferase